MLKEDIYNRKHILYIEDSPMSFTEDVLESKKILPVILRFKHLASNFEEEYLLTTETNFYVFWVDIMRPIKQEVRRFIHWQKFNGVQVTYFLNPSEVAQYYAQEFARYLKLPSLTEEQTMTCRNKLIMKQKLRDLGINTAKYQEVFSIKELINFGEKHGWPIILKPTDSSSCRETYLLSNAQDAKSAYIHSGNEWIVEEYLDMEEFSVDAIVFNGKVIDYFHTIYPKPLLKTLKGEINANITLRSYKKEFKQNIEKMLEKYIKGISLDHGYVHMEYFSDEDGENVYVGEVGIRLPGGDILSNYKLSYGINFSDVLIDIHINELPNLKYKENRFVGNLLLPIKKGYVKKISSLEYLKQFEGVLDGNINVKEGEYTNPELTSFACSGNLFIEGNSTHEVENRMREVLAQYEFVVIQSKDNPKV